MSHAPTEADRVEEPEEELSDPLIVLRAGERLLALPLECVREVVTARAAAPLPGAPAAVNGLVNVRGRAVTVVDLGTVLGQAPAADADDHRVLVVEHRGLQVGVAVSDVVRMARLPVADLVPADDDRRDGWLQAVTRLEGRDVGVLDADGLLHSVLA